MIKGIIYKWTNKINNKVYIGKTIDEKKRISSHINDRRSFSAFHNAIDKYGIDNFNYEVLFFTASNSNDRMDTILNSMEKYYIKKFKSNNRNYGYNLTEGGDGVSGRYGESNPFYGKHHTDEVKNKQSTFIKSIYDKVQSEDAKQKRIESLKKVKHSYEWNEKVRLANEKPITAYKNNIIVGSWKCYKDCANALGFTNIQGISKVVCGNCKTYKGYTFVQKYTDTNMNKIENNGENSSQKQD